LLLPLLEGCHAGGSARGQLQVLLNAMFRDSSLPIRGIEISFWQYGKRNFPKRIDLKVGADKGVSRSLRQWRGNN